MLDRQYVDIQIPFCGFHESEANAVINEALDEYYSHLPDERFPFKLIEEPFVLQGFSEEYTNVFQNFFNTATSLSISLIFKSLTSPEFYDEDTDRIICQISRADVLALREAVKDDVLALCFSEIPTIEDPGAKPVFEWTTEQLEILMIAVMMSRGAVGLDYFEVMKPMKLQYLVEYINDNRKEVKR